jgi:hypothetical protein
MLISYVSWGVCLLMSPGYQSPQPINIHDGFELLALSRAWSTERFLPGAVSIQSKIVRAGKSAARITLHQGDQVGDEKGTNLEQAELMEARELTSLEDSTFSYSFSMFLPRDFPVVPTGLVIAQWKQYCRSGKCGEDSPVLALRYQSGRFRVTLRAGPKTQALYDTADEIRGKWLDFTFLITFSRQQHGRIRAWLNDREIANHTGVTAYSEASGYPAPGRFYFKMGLYRDRMKEPMTIYVDEYRKNQPSKSDFRAASMYWSNRRIQPEEYVEPMELPETS